jgi:hypothetical protein
MNEIELTRELAEAAGIHAGDGYLRYIGKRQEIDISGHVEERGYYDNHVIPLFNGLFGTSVSGKHRMPRNTYGLVIYKRSVLKVFKDLGFPSGAKSKIVRVPLQIMKSKDDAIICAFLRGVFDTDGYLNFMNRSNADSFSDFKKKYHYYPRIFLTSVSELFIKDLQMLVDSLGFRSHITSHPRAQENWNTLHKVCILGETNLSKWMELIGTKNPTKLSRYEVWDKFGFCPINLTHDQRINILKGRLDPYKLY